MGIGALRLMITHPGWFWDMTVFGSGWVVFLAGGGAGLIRFRLLDLVSMGGGFCFGVICSGIVWGSCRGMGCAENA